MKSNSFTLILFLLALGGQMQAQFFATGGPIAGGNSDAIYAFGDTAFVDINSNPWRSFDGGQTWDICNGNLPLNLNPDAFVKRGSTIYMGTNSGDRVYKSTDYGDNWEVMYEGLPKLVGFPSAVPKHLTLSGDRVFIGGTNFGLQYLDTNEESWVRVNLGTGDLVFSISVIGEDSLMVNQGTGFNNFTYFSADNGDTWTQLAAEPVTVRTIASTGFGQIGNILVAITDAGGANQAYYSQDFGQSWILSNGGPAVSEQLIQVREDLIFAINFEGIYRTTDGINWTFVEGTSGGNGLAYWKGSEVIYSSFGTGLKSGDGEVGGNFQEQQIAVSTMKDLFVQDNLLYALSERGIHTYNGQGWQTLSIIADLAKLDLINPGNFFDLDIVDGNFYLCGNDGYYKSTDGGLTFSNIDYFDGERVVMADQQGTQELVFVADGVNPFDPSFSVSRVYYYDAENDTYQQATLDGDLVNFAGLPRSLIKYGGKSYLSVDRQVVYESSDNGRTWISITLTNRADLLVIFDGKIFIDAYSNPSGRILYTEDGFATLQEVDLSGIPRGNEFLDWWYFEEIFVADGKLFVYQNDPVFSLNGPGNGNGLYSIDGATASWAFVEESELPAPPSFFLDYQDGLYAGVPNWSVWSNKEPLSTSVSNLERSATPPVFPNPTKDLLNIPNPDGQTWQLYDLRGALQQSGNRNETNISELPAGLYILQLNGQNWKILKVN
ncbi:MAG: T9SS type A sorting domain-containing protein [Bacteroidota bacterium]